MCKLYKFVVSHDFRIHCENGRFCETTASCRSPTTVHCYSSMRCCYRLPLRRFSIKFRVPILKSDQFRQRQICVAVRVLISPKRDTQFELYEVTIGRSTRFGVLVVTVAAFRVWDGKRVALYGLRLFWGVSENGEGRQRSCLARFSTYPSRDNPFPRPSGVSDTT